MSTDADDIARTSESYGAEAPFRRPVEIAQDDSPHILAVLHALEWLDVHDHYRPDAVCLLQPTSPLRVVADIDGAIALAQEKKAEAVVTVTESVEHPVLSRRMDGSGVLTPFIPGHIDYPRRQDLPPAYAINGAVYVNRSESLKTKRTFYPEALHGYVIPADRTLQIDTPWEFHLAELVLKDRLSIMKTPRRGSA